MSKFDYSEATLGKKCENYEKLGGGVVKCLACYHHCILNPGPPNPELEEDPRASIGICTVRHNWKGELRLMDHSKPVMRFRTFIEKIPLFHFYPLSQFLFLGTSGCNFRCTFCQAWEIAQFPKIKMKRKVKDGYLHDIEDAFRVDSEWMPPEEVIKIAKKYKCAGISMSMYNEPTIVFDTYLLDICKLAKANGLKIALCSNGYQSVETLNKVAKYVDAISIGLKACSIKFYTSLVGARLSPILRNIRIWREMGIWIEIQSLLIPELSDSDEDIIALCRAMTQIDPNMVLHFGHYEDEYKILSQLEKERRDQRFTKPYTFERAMSLAKKLGVRYVYSDHPDNRKYHSTYCPNCQAKVADRGCFDGKFGIRFNNKDHHGTCGECGTVLHGYWNDECILPLVPRDRRELEVVPEHLTRRNFLITEHNDVTIVFASQTGVSEEYAYSLKEYGKSVLKDKRIETHDLFYYNEERMHRERILIIVTSTYFYGRIPRNGKYFYEYLMKNTKKDEELDLSNVCYAVVGIGSTGDMKIHFETYQVIARQIDERMRFLGAKRIMMIEADKKKDFKKTLEEGKVRLFEEIRLRLDDIPDLETVE